MILLAVLVLRPNGLFNSAAACRRAAHRHVFRHQPAVRLPRWLVAALAAAALVLPLVVDNRTSSNADNAWLYGMLALSLTLVAGIAGQISLGHAGLLAIGGYALGAAGDQPGPAGRSGDLQRRGDHRAAGGAADLPGVPAARPLCRDRHARHRRDREPGHPQLGQPDARPARPEQHSAACVGWAADCHAPGDLLAVAGLLLALALLQLRLLARTWAARCGLFAKTRWRRSLWHQPESLQGARLRRQRLYRRDERGVHRAHVCLHQPRNIQRHGVACWR